MLPNTRYAKQIKKLEYTETNYVNICPKCGSTNIHLETRFLGGYTEGGGGNFCRNCNYGVDRIVIFPEIEKSKIEEFRKEIQKNQLNQ